MADHIKIKSNRSGKESRAANIKINSNGSAKESVNFDIFFPNFIWAVRDFCLDLVIDDKKVTEDEYLEHALKLKSGTTQKDTDYNLLRKCIIAHFPQRKCYTFPMPAADWNNLKNLNSLDDKQLAQEFLSKTEEFIQYVFDSTKPKSVDGRIINGRILGGLARCYVDAIRKGAVPCILSAVESTAKLENERAIKESVALYEKRFRETVKFPTETMIEVSNCHHVCENEAAEYFMKLAIFDDAANKPYYKRMVKELAASYESFVKENETSSQRACHSLLCSLHKPIEDDFKQGKYACPGGHEVYKRSIDLLIRKYREAPRKGIMSEGALREFMKQQEPTSAAVLKADENLTEETKKVEEEKRKAEASERERIAAEEEAHKQKQLKEDEKKSHADHIRRLKTQDEEERKKIIDDCEKALERQKERLLKDGSDQKALEEKINDLTKTIEDNKGGFLNFLMMIYEFFRDLGK